MRELPVLQIGESRFHRLERLFKECPRRLGWDEHESRYYHVRNRSGVTCVMDIMPPRELHKYIGKWSY